MWKLQVSLIGLWSVCPQGAAEHQPWGSQLPRDSVMARDVLWVNRVTSGRKKSNLSRKAKIRTSLVPLEASAKSAGRRTK